MLEQFILSLLISVSFNSDYDIDSISDKPKIRIGMEKEELVKYYGFPYSIESGPCFVANKCLTLKYKSKICELNMCLVFLGDDKVYNSRDIKSKYLDF